MRYDEMLRIYPDIEQLFSNVSRLVHDDKCGASMAGAWAARWISGNIDKKHRTAVEQKIQRFIKAICADDIKRGALPCDTQAIYIAGWKRN